MVISIHYLTTYIRRDETSLSTPLPSLEPWRCTGRHMARLYHPLHSIYETPARAAEYNA
jgi:hypothetical protein